MNPEGFETGVIPGSSPWAPAENDLSLRCARLERENRELKKAMVEAQVPTFHVNCATMHLNGDQLVMSFWNTLIDPTDPAQVGVVIPPDPIAIMAMPRTVRIVATFSVAALLNDYLIRSLPGARKERGAPAGIQGNAT